MLPPENCPKQKFLDCKNRLPLNLITLQEILIPFKRAAGIILEESLFADAAHMLTLIDPILVHQLFGGRISPLIVHHSLKFFISGLFLTLNQQLGGRVDGMTILLEVHGPEESTSRLYGIWHIFFDELLNSNIIDWFCSLRFKMVAINSSLGCLLYEFLL